MKLTNLACKNAKAKDKKYKLSDGNGLNLRIDPTGRKYWVFRFRFDGKHKEMSFGVFPTLSIIAARKKASDAKELLADGLNPIQAKKTKILDNVEASQATFEVIATEWFELYKKGVGHGTSVRAWGGLKKHIIPYIGNAPISAVTPPQLLKLLRRIQDAGTIEIARRTNGYCNMVYNYALGEGYVESDPSLGMSKLLIKSKTTHYKTIDCYELHDFLKALANQKKEVSPQMRLATKMLLYTFVRTSDLLKASWSEFNLENNTWYIPAERMKKDRPHAVPLSNEMLKCLELLKMFPSDSDYLFPGRLKTSKNPTVSNTAILKALERIGYGGKMTGHGFRALAETTLLEFMGWPEEIIDVQLAHAKDKVKAAYNRAKFLPQRRQMMQEWADFVVDVEKNGKKNISRYQKKAIERQKKFAESKYVID